MSGGDYPCTRETEAGAAFYGSRWREHSWLFLCVAEEVEVSDSERESPKRRAGQVEGEGGSDEEMLAGGGGDDDDDDEYQVSQH